MWSQGDPRLPVPAASDHWQSARLAFQNPCALLYNTVTSRISWITKNKWRSVQILIQLHCNYRVLRPLQLSLWGVSSWGTLARPRLFPYRVLIRVIANNLVAVPCQSEGSWSKHSWKRIGILGSLGQYLIQKFSKKSVFSSFNGKRNPQGAEVQPLQPEYSRHSYK